MTFHDASLDRAARTVVPKPQPAGEAQFHALIVAGLARVASKVGRGTLADGMGRTTRALDKVFGGSMPDAKALLDGLLLDGSLLDEVLAHYGFRLEPLGTLDSEGDLRIAAELCVAASSLIAAQGDGRRDHRETLAIADLVRPLVPHLAAIVHEADEIRSARK